MKSSILKIAPAIALTLMFSACGEEGEGGEGGPGNGNTEERLATFFLQAESVASNTYSVMDQARRDSLVAAGDTSTINGAMTYQNGGNVVIDYGNGVQGTDGITRTGQISMSENNDYFTSGGSLTASFNNYTVDEKPITGNIVVSNLGADEFDINISNFSYGGEFNYSAGKSLTWVSGFATKSDANDDKFEVTGMSSGTEVSTSNSVNATFQDKLVIDRSCIHNVVEGIMDLSLAGDSSITFNNATLDFIKSDGCNNHVTITIKGDNGSSLTLPKTFSGF